MRNGLSFMKKKKIIIISSVILILFLVGLSIFFYIRHQKQIENKINDIRNHYHEYILLSQDANLYTMSDKQYEMSGTVKQGMTLVLENVEIQDVNQEYFKVKNEDYYVFYQDVEPTDVINPASVPEYYLTSNDRIQTKDMTTFYLNEEPVISFNKRMDFVYVSQDEGYYQVQYLGKILDLKKDEVEIQKSEEVKEQTTFVPVLQIQEIKEGCTDSSCITLDKAKEILNQFHEKEFYTINNIDFDLWTKGYVSLKKGAMILNFVKFDESVSSLLESYGYTSIQGESIKCNLNNQSAKIGTPKENLNSYPVSQNTTNEYVGKMLNGEEVVIPKPRVSSSNVTPKSLPSMDAKATNIAVLNYHFFYANGESCGGGNCLEVTKFREQLQYLKDNHYKTLTMEEYRAWMYGEIDLPARSVLLTIDDGAMGTGKHNGNKLIPLLEEYDAHATLFLISGWWAKENYISPNLDIESHTYDMHTERVCSTESRGAQMLCSSKEQVMEDLRKSIEIIGSNTAFCFPFYVYNASALQSVKDSGFKLAFVGGGTKSNRNNDKFRIPRYPIHSDISMNQFINMIA